LQRYNPERDKAEFEAAWAARQSRAGGSVLTYEPHYEGSSVIDGPPGGKSSAHGTHTFSARAGHHLAPQLLTSGRNVFEELGLDFTLLAFGAIDAAVQAFEQAAAAAHVPLKVVRDSYAGGREAYEHRLVLVRPDQYVAWTGDDAPPDITVLLGRLTGR
jgi:hypothetical protein